MMHTCLTTYLTGPNVLLPGTLPGPFSLLGGDNIELNLDFVLNLNGSSRDAHGSDPEVCLFERN
jgi:hypothetical protein